MTYTEGDQVIFDNKLCIVSHFDPIYPNFIKLKSDNKIFWCFTTDIKLATEENLIKIL